MDPMVKPWDDEGRKGVIIRPIRRGLGHMSPQPTGYRTAQLNGYIQTL